MQFISLYHLKIKQIQIMKYIKFGGIVLVILIFAYFLLTPHQMHLFNSNEINKVEIDKKRNASLDTSKEKGKQNLNSIKSLKKLPNPKLPNRITLGGLLNRLYELKTTILENYEPDDPSKYHEFFKGNYQIYYDDKNLVVLLMYYKYPLIIIEKSIYNPKFNKVLIDAMWQPFNKIGFLSKDKILFTPNKKNAGIGEEGFSKDIYIIRNGKLIEDLGLGFKQYYRTIDLVELNQIKNRYGDHKIYLSDFDSIPKPRIEPFEKLIKNQIETRLFPIFEKWVPTYRNQSLTLNSDILIDTLGRVRFMKVDLKHAIETNVIRKEILNRIYQEMKSIEDFFLDEIHFQPVKNGNRKVNYFLKQNISYKPNPPAAK